METRSITAEVPMVPRMSEDPAQLVPELAEVSAALFKVTGNGSVPRSTISLVQLRAGQIVGSTYLTVLHTGFLRKAGPEATGGLGHFVRVPAHGGRGEGLPPQGVRIAGRCSGVVQGRERGAHHQVVPHVAGGEMPPCTGRAGDALLRCERLPQGEADIEPSPAETERHRADREVLGEPNGIKAPGADGLRDVVQKREQPGDVGPSQEPLLVHLAEAGPQFRGQEDQEEPQDGLHDRFPSEDDQQRATHHQTTGHQVHQCGDGHGGRRFHPTAAGGREFMDGGSWARRPALSGQVHLLCPQFRVRWNSRAGPALLAGQGGPGTGETRRRTVPNPAGDGSQPFEP